MRTATRRLFIAPQGSTPGHVGDSIQETPSISALVSVRSTRTSGTSETPRVPRAAVCTVWSIVPWIPGQTRASWPGNTGSTRDLNVPSGTTGWAQGANFQPRQAPASTMPTRPAGVPISPDASRTRRSKCLGHSTRLNGSSDEARPKMSAKDGLEGALVDQSCIGTKWMRLLFYRSVPGRSMPGTHSSSITKMTSLLLGAAPVYASIMQPPVYAARWQTEPAWKAAKAPHKARQSIPSRYYSSMARQEPARMDRK